MTKKIKTKTKKRPTWDEIFLLEAILWSKRSLDPDTQCGCVLVKDKTVISTGYNSFIRDIDDNVLPTTRPDKYKYFIHAEQNAIFQSCRNGYSTIGAIAYITGTPCINCLQYMWQTGIRNIIITDYSKPKMVTTEEYSSDLNLLKKAGMYFNTYFVPYSQLKEWQ